MSICDVCIRPVYCFNGSRIWILLLHDHMVINHFVVACMPWKRAFRKEKIDAKGRRTACACACEHEIGFHRGSKSKLKKKTCCVNQTSIFSDSLFNQYSAFLSEKVFRLAKCYKAEKIIRQYSSLQLTFPRIQSMALIEFFANWQKIANEGGSTNWNQPLSSILNTVNFSFLIIFLLNQKFSFDSEDH